MPEDSRLELRRFANTLLDAFVEVVSRQNASGTITPEVLKRAAAGIEHSPAFNALLESFARRMGKEAEAEILRQQRSHPFHRLIVHPLSDSFTYGRLSRDILANYFTFIHMVMGDRAAALAVRCKELCGDEMQNSDYNWDAFYNLPEAKQILWSVLVDIAASFKRFDARREWFIDFMQRHPHSISLASTAFLPLPQDDSPPPPFNADQFNLMFAALFGSVRHLSPQDRLLFERAFKLTPETAFGQLWLELERLGVTL
jgi:hypothetical protein